MFAYPRFLTTFAIVFAQCVITSADEGERKLRLKLDVGRKFAYEIVQDMDLTLTIGATTTKTVVNQTIDLEWTVLKQTETDDVVMRQKITRMRLTLDSPATGKIEFDSDSDADVEGVGKLLSPLLSTVVGSEVQMNMSPRGDVNKIVVPADVLGAFKKVPGAKMFGEMFSQEGFRKLIKQASMVLPEKVEKDWKRTQPHTIKNALLGKMTADTTYTYAGTETVDGRELAKFDVAVEIAFDEEKKGLAKVAIKKQDSSGSIYFDPAAGRMDHTHVKQNLELDVSIAGQEVKQKIVSETKLKVKGGK